jgi:hypothetical protein
MGARRFPQLSVRHVRVQSESSASPPSELYSEADDQLRISAHNVVGLGGRLQLSCSASPVSPSVLRQYGNLIRALTHDLRLAAWGRNRAPWLRGLLFEHGDDLLAFCGLIYNYIYNLVN